MLQARPDADPHALGPPPPQRTRARIPGHGAASAAQRGYFGLVPATARHCQTAYERSHAEERLPSSHGPQPRPPSSRAGGAKAQGSELGLHSLFLFPAPASGEMLPGAGRGTSWRCAGQGSCCSSVQHIARRRPPGAAYRAMYPGPGSRPRPAQRRRFARPGPNEGGAPPR